MSKHILVIAVVCVLALAGLVYAAENLNPGGIQSIGNVRYVEKGDTRLVVSGFPDGGVIPTGGANIRIYYQTLDMTPTAPESINANHDFANTGPFFDVKVVRMSDHVVIYSGTERCDLYKDVPSNAININPVGYAGTYELRIFTTDSGSYTPQSMTLTMTFAG
jgi:hypothetical protein